MKRNVIKLGQSTLVVSLPTKWAQENGIKQKAELDVEEDGATLHIRSADERTSERSVVLEFSEKDWKEPRPEKYVQRRLATAYKQGMSKITVRSTSKTILDYVESRAEGFIGLEIVEQKKDSLVLKTVTAGEEANFETVLSRAINLTSHIASGTYDALARNDKLERANLLRLERTHNKVTDYIKRALAIRRSTWEDKYLYSFIAEDERLVDEFKYLLAAAKKPSKRTLLLLKEAIEYLLFLLELLQHPSEERVVRLSREYIPLRSRAKALIAEHVDPASSMHLYNIVVATYELGETILEWKLR